MKKSFSTIAVAAVALFAAVAYGRNKKKREAEQEAARLAAEKKNPPAPAKQDSSFAEQVRKFQSLMGLSADGIIGPKTLAAAQSLGISVLDYSTILKAIALALVKKAAQSTLKLSSDKMTRAKQIWAAISDSVPARFRLKTMGAAMYFDKSKGQYLPTGGKFYIVAGSSFLKSGVKNDPVKTGNFVAVVPVEYQGDTVPRLMVFGPENLYV